MKLLITSRRVSSLLIEGVRSREGKLLFSQVGQ